MRGNVVLGLALAVGIIVGAQAQPVGSIPWSAVGPGLNICGGNKLCTNGPDSTKTASYTLAAGDMGGQVNFSGTGLTLTVPAISTTVLAQGMTVTVANQGSGALTVSSTPTINGCAASGSLGAYGSMILTSNGTSLDSVCVPGFVSITANSLAKMNAAGQLAPSGISDNGSQVTISENLALNVTGSTQCLHASSTGVVSGTGADCGSGGGGAVTMVPPQGRLYLTTGQPYPTTDVVNTSTIYYGCVTGKNVPYYTGSADALAQIPSCEVSDVLPTTGTGVVNTTQVVDFFYVGASNSLVHCTNGSGGGWASDTSGSNTARGTGYSAIHNTRGYWTNTNALSNCYNGSTLTTVSADQGTYVGTVYTTGAGTTSMQLQPAAAAGGTNNVLGVWNAYNQRMVYAMNRDSTTSYVYSSTTWRQMNNNANNRVSFPVGIIGGQIETSWAYEGGSSGSTTPMLVGINCNSTTATPINGGYIPGTAGQFPFVTVNSACAPGAGLNYTQGMEATQTSGTGTTIFPAGTPQGRILIGVPM